jgi:oligopeptide/dipeptide ABC transporter ATP-binding protein
MMGVNMNVDYTLIVKNLKKWFPIQAGILSFFQRKGWVRAVDGISFEVGRNEILGLAGESGCGKTTTGRTVLKLLEPTDGKIFFERQDITNLKPNDMKKYRRFMQIIFQDPYRSLNPRKNVLSIISQPIDAHGLVADRAEKLEMVNKILEEVKLHPSERYLYKYPHELSGGERQRVALARALILKPKFIVADEPVSMLDALIRIDMLNVMLDLRKKIGFACLFVTHDLALARYICDRIAIMYLGKIIEVAPKEELLSTPVHPYTKALISAVPIPNPSARKVEVRIKGGIISPTNLPSGCRFNPRCPNVRDICQAEEPQLVEVSKNHYVACHRI